MPVSVSNPLIAPQLKNQKGSDSFPLLEYRKRAKHHLVLGPLATQTEPHSQERHPIKTIHELDSPP